MIIIIIIIHIMYKCIEMRIGIGACANNVFSLLFFHSISLSYSCTLVAGVHANCTKFSVQQTHPIHTHILTHIHTHTYKTIQFICMSSTSLLMHLMRIHALQTSDYINCIDLSKLSVHLCSS